MFELIERFLQFIEVKVKIEKFCFHYNIEFELSNIDITICWLNRSINPKIFVDTALES